VSAHFIVYLFMVMKLKILKSIVSTRDLGDSFRIMKNPYTFLGDGSVTMSRVICTPTGSDLVN
jgi:hypothetical protein